jgi:hypothetical protein
MIAVIAVGAVLVLVIAVLVGFRIGQSVLTGAPSSAVSTGRPSPVAVPSGTPTVESEPTESPEPEPVITSAAPTAPRPTYVPLTPTVPVTQTPLPEVSFAEVQPLPPPPPAEAPEELPAAPPSPTPEPTCPADKGVTLTIVKAELDPIATSASHDVFRLTFVLDNKFSVPVSIRVGETLEATAVRDDGAEMGTGNVTLPEPYEEVPPGRRTFAMEGNDYVMTQQTGSSIASFKLSGSAWLYTNTWDTENSMSCEYKGLSFGKPLQGYWPSS